DKPVLGVCLGMQGMLHFAGGRVVPLDGALHGRPSRIVHDGSGVFRGLPSGFSAIRYHSLVAEEASLPHGVHVTTNSADDGQVMGIVFAGRPWFGVQCHPYSVGTESGLRQLADFIGISASGSVRPDAHDREGFADVRAASKEAPAWTMPHLELSWRDPADVFARH